MSMTDLQNFTGLTSSQITNLMKYGDFPQPHRIVFAKMAWRYSEVKAWQDKQKENKNKKDNNNKE